MSEANEVIVKELMLMMNTQFFILFDALYRKGAIDYESVQEAIAVAREMIPPHHYSDGLRDYLNILEQTYHPGGQPPPFPWPKD